MTMRIVVLAAVLTASCVPGLQRVTVAPGVDAVEALAFAQTSIEMGRPLDAMGWYGRVLENLEVAPRLRDEALWGAAFLHLSTNPALEDWRRALTLFEELAQLPSTNPRALPARTAAAMLRRAIQLRGETEAAAGRAEEARAALRESERRAGTLEQQLAALERKHDEAERRRAVLQNQNEVLRKELARLRREVAAVGSTRR